MTSPDRAWLVLLLSGVLEAVWAVALGRTEGFTRLVPSAVFLVSLPASMAGLAFAMRTLPVGTAYAVWVGVGAALTVAVGMVTGEEPVGVARLPLLCGLVAAWSGSSSCAEARPRSVGRAPCPTSPCHAGRTDSTPTDRHGIRGTGQFAASGPVRGRDRADGSSSGPR